MGKVGARQNAAVWTLLILTKVLKVSNKCIFLSIGRSIDYLLLKQIK